MLYYPLYFQEQEARTNALRVKARAVYDGRDEETKSQTLASTSKKPEHVNFFKELEEGLVSFTGTNNEYEKEKKEEKEKYEKQIGYLTYLGQDTVEVTGNVSWYNKVPERLLVEVKTKEELKELNEKSKKLVDPLNHIRRYLGMTSMSKPSEIKYERNKTTELSKSNKKMKRKYEGSSGSEEEYTKQKGKKQKRKRHTHSENKHEKKRHKERSSSESSESDKLTSQTKVDIDTLRAERLRRENKEKHRAQMTLAKLRGETLPEDKPKDVVPEIKQKYSSQFNPHLARQNYDNEKKMKSW